MFDSLVEVFERFQTFLVGLLGFAGVICTIIMNERLKRQQHERELIQERTALRTALIAELSALRKTYEDRIHSLHEKDRGQAALIPEYVSNQVYCQLLDRIGLLTAEEIEPVMDAYILVTELPVRLRLLAGDAGELSEYSGYIHISGEHAEVAAKIHDSFLAKINTAVASIQRKLEKIETKRKS
jgi:hypothetical protein